MQENNIELLRSEIKRLKELLNEKEKLLEDCLQEENNKKNEFPCEDSRVLSKLEISRYSRQMLVPEIGFLGQIKLKNSKILIVGAGGLGCPAALYLAAAGVGEITIVDCDEVEISNLHRQILHAENDVGWPKVESAFKTLHKINGNIKIIPLKKHLVSNSMQKLISSNKFDVVIDGSDNVATRYLLNDACILNNMPLISGSALQTEAQLTIYNYKNGPCYRCLFPKPPPPESVTSCGDGGVLGPIPGLIGILQALQCIKILVGGTTNIDDVGILSEKLLLVDGWNLKFRTVALRHKNPNCDICGEKPIIHDLIDYEEFCGAKADDKVVNINIITNPKCNLDIHDLPYKLGSSVIIDVRPKIQYEISHLAQTVNFPYENFKRNELEFDKLRKYLLLECPRNSEIYLICRRGNDSQRALIYINRRFKDDNIPIKLINIKGGLEAYAKHIDPNFPFF